LNCCASRHSLSVEVNAMASNIDHEGIRLPPAEQPSAAEYWSDFYSWLVEQAAHVRAGRWEALDRENLAEEIESLGREQFNKLESALRVLMMHMLKWDHQPKLRSRSWVLSIEAQRLELDDVLSDDPGLKPRNSLPSLCRASSTLQPSSRPPLVVRQAGAKPEPRSRRTF